MTQARETSALLIPCYNAVRFLPRLREQIDRLSPQFDEVLLVDDCSTDETAVQAEALGFRIIRSPENRGPGGARNLLVTNCSADWIHFHDVDDEIAPDYLSSIAKADLSAHDVIFHFLDFINEERRDLIIRWSFDPASLAADPSQTLLRGPLPTMSSFIRRTAFLAVGGFDAVRRCFEDGDLHFRLAAAGFRIGSVPEVLGWSLRHGAGAGANQLYCFKCRLSFLEGYADSQPERLRDAIGAEAERAAQQLVELGDLEAARRAIQLCFRLGRAVPTTANPLLRILRIFFSAERVLGWQNRRRKQAKA